MTAKSIPEGHHSLTPNLTVDNGLEALTFYENGFGADVLRKHVIGSKLMHAESGRLAKRFSSTALVRRSRSVASCKTRGGCSAR
jgi:uncharacterized glyoxalase superfamily protein PhnB